MLQLLSRNYNDNKQKKNHNYRYLNVECPMTTVPVRPARNAELLLGFFDNYNLFNFKNTPYKNNNRKDTDTHNYYCGNACIFQIMLSIKVCHIVTYLYRIKENILNTVSVCYMVYGQTKISDEMII